MRRQVSRRYVVEGELTTDRRGAGGAGTIRGFGGLHPLLFGAYPVLFLWSQNVGETSIAIVAAPLLVVLVVTLVVTVGTGLVLRDLRRGALVVTPLVGGLLMYGHVVELLDPLPVPVRLQQAGWVGLVVLGIVAALWLRERPLARLDTALTRIGLLLVAVSLVSILPTQLGGSRDVSEARALLAGDRALATTTDAPRRDVYWLVFDRYGSDRSLELEYGVRNPLTPWLRERGFSVLEDSHANYVKTALSMSTTLNINHLGPLAERMGPDNGDHAPVYAALQDSVVARQFKALGYTYHHIGSWWEPTRVDAAADVNYNAAGVSDFAAVLFDTSALPVIGRTVGLVERGSTRRTRHFDHNLFALATLDALRAEPGPKFVLAHVLLPHAPLVFDRDGSYLRRDELETLSAREAWQRQFEYTNSRLQAFLEPLLALPEQERPIIIFQADEGPWSQVYSDTRRTYDWATATGDELEVKFGIMNAWYLPRDIELELDPALTAINTFAVLFRDYFGLPGYELQPDRVFSSRTWGRPYDLTDITERLPSLR